MASFSTISFAGFGGPGWLFGIFGAIALSLFGLSVGRTKAVISLFSVYIAFAFEKLFPYLNSLSGLLEGKIETHWLRIGLFLGSYLAIFIIFSLSFIRKRISSQDYSLFGILILSVVQLGFLASIILNILPQDLAIQWSFGFYNYFANSTALFFWALAPLPIMMLIRK